MSATTASATDEGPLLVTTIVYVSTSSGLATARPSVLVIDRSTCGVNGSLSVAELLPATGSVTPAGTATVAVLLMLPVAPAVTVPLTVYVTVAPTGRLTVSLIEPLPEPAQLPPGRLRHKSRSVPVSDAGRGSVTVAPTTADGPALEAVTYR